MGDPQHIKKCPCRHATSVLLTDKQYRVFCRVTSQPPNQATSPQVDVLSTAVMKTYINLFGTRTGCEWSEVLSQVIMKNVVFCHMTSCSLQNSAASIFPVEDGKTGSLRTGDKHLSHYMSVPEDGNLCIVECRAVSRQRLGKRIRMQ
jgi:hypothetical protein